MNKQFRKKVTSYDPCTNVLSYTHILTLYKRARVHTHKTIYSHAHVERQTNRKTGTQIHICIYVSKGVHSVTKKT